MAETSDDDKRKQFIEALNGFLDGDICCCYKHNIVGMKLYIRDKLTELRISVTLPENVETIDIIKLYTISDSLHEYFYDILINVSLKNRDSKHLIRRNDIVRLMINDIKHFINDEELTYSFGCTINRTFNQINDISEAINLLLNIIHVYDNYIDKILERLTFTYGMSTCILFFYFNVNKRLYST